MAKLDVIQNEGMRAILGCTCDTSAAAMSFVLGFSAMRERHKQALVVAYLNVCADPQHPLHHKVGTVVETKLKRGTEWMNQAAQTMEKCSISAEAIRQGQSWIKIDDEDVMFNQVVVP